MQVHVKQKYKHLVSVDAMMPGEVKEPCIMHAHAHKQTQNWLLVFGANLAGCLATVYFFGYLTQLFQAEPWLRCCICPKCLTCVSCLPWLEHRAKKNQSCV
jgi:hypothetical protein